MSQNYKLVKRSSKPGDNTAEKKFYAVTKGNGVTDLDTLCSHISARSTVSSADVKAVLDSLNYVLDVELKAGRIVHIGELGNFRVTVGSEGASDSKSFSNSLLRKPKIVFTPGAPLRKTRNGLEFKRVNTSQGEGEGTENGNTGAQEPGDI